ncbi:MAG: DNA polymerase III subunit gamma/tau [Candidatus Melainabacteria bacterium]|nr:DNA polymerase III subunit gamma/tau [Candidatus Melainabacteria bacterium]
MEGLLHGHNPFYLKYRPQVLADLIGQPAVARTLSNAILYGKLSHAYLLTGPRGTGKTSTARILAKSLNCDSGPTASPCLSCTSCKEIKAGMSPAVLEIDAASNNSVDDARALIERAPLVAFGGRFKLYIIDECHMLTKEAFNALLKTIEEPPANVVFVLATTEEHKVPPTIVSRCQRLMFRLVSEEDLAKHLSQVAKAEMVNIEDDAIDLISRHSSGAVRDALALLEQASLLSTPDVPVTVNDLLLLLGAVAEDMLLSISQQILLAQGELVVASVNQLISEGREPAVVAAELVRHFLNLIKAAYVSRSGALGVDSAHKYLVGSSHYLLGLFAQAPQFDLAQLSEMIDLLSSLEQTLRRTTQGLLHLEIGLLALCHRQDMSCLRVLEQRLARLEALLADKSTYRLDSDVHPVPTRSALLESVNAEPAVAAPEEAPVESLTYLEQPSEANLDTFWSCLLEEVKGHPNIYSVLSIYPFPLSLDKEELVIGVTKELWKSNVERKLESIKTSCAKLLGRTINVRVKIVESAPERYELGNVQSADCAQGSSFELTSEAASAKELTNDLEQPIPSNSRSSMSVVKEAYKLFEGPGSRLIS